MCLKSMYSVRPCFFLKDKKYCTFFNNSLFLFISVNAEYTVNPFLYGVLQSRLLGWDFSTGWVFGLTVFASYAWGAHVQNKHHDNILQYSVCNILCQMVE